jgi:hypothetical protein
MLELFSRRYTQRHQVHNLTKALLAQLNERVPNDLGKQEYTFPLYPGSQTRKIVEIVPNKNLNRWGKASSTLKELSLEVTIEPMMSSELNDYNMRLFSLVAKANRTVANQLRPVVTSYLTIVEDITLEELIDFLKSDKAEQMIGASFQTFASEERDKRTILHWSLGYALGRADIDEMQDFTVEYACLEDLLQTNAKLSVHRAIDILPESDFYRNILLTNTPEDAADMLRADSYTFKMKTDKEQLVRIISRMVKELKRNYTTITLRCNEDVCINGHVYHGIDDIIQAACDSDAPVSGRYERFPCFDYYDRINENRYYCNYWFCSKDSEEWKVIQSLNPEQGNYCFLNGYLPPEALPMIYYKDEDSFMTLAVEKQSSEQSREA